MKDLPWPLVLLLAVFGTLVSTAAADEPGVDVAVARALPYLQREGLAWIDKRGCVSCHQVPFMLWSLSSARRHGFDVDPAELDRWQQWSIQVANFVQPDQKEDLDVDKTLASNIDTMSALLLAVNEDSIDNELPAWRTMFAEALATNQEENGAWKPCGQLPMQKRPLAETTRVTALWTLLALTNPKPDGADLEKAIVFVDQGESARSTEWWVARLLLAHQQRDDRAASLRNDLITRRHEDGGWGWLTDDPSDAMATGMAVYALRVTDGGDRETASIIEHAKQFLITTQKPEGFWTVNGTKTATRNKPTPTATYWGTAWAVIGLLESR